MSKNRYMIFSCVVVASLGVGIILYDSEAKADLFTQCPVKSGSTRFFDFESNGCGYVFGNNAHWSALPGGWNDRADQFGNDGVTDANCLWQDASCNGQVVPLPRGSAVFWPNIVSSNRWTNLGICSPHC